MNHFIPRTFLIAAIAAVTVAGVNVAPVAAKTYSCTPDAIKVKKDYTIARFQDFVAGKYSNKGNFGPVLAKVWDGQGDCDTNGSSVGKLPQEAQMNLVLMHYYGDVMTTATYVSAKKFADARAYVDDYKQVHGIIAGPLKPSFDAGFFSQDKDITDQMRDFDKQVTAAGSKTKVTDKI